MNATPTPTVERRMNDCESTYGLTVEVWPDRRIAVMNPTVDNMTNYEDALAGLKEAMTWLLRSCSGLRHNAERQFEVRRRELALQSSLALARKKSYLAHLSQTPWYASAYEALRFLCTGKPGAQQAVKTVTDSLNVYESELSRLESSHASFSVSLGRLEDDLYKFQDKLKADYRTLCSSVWSEVETQRQHYTPLEYFLVADLNKATWKELVFFLRASSLEFDPEFLTLSENDLIKCYQPSFAKVE